MPRRAPTEDSIVHTTHDDPCHGTLRTQGGKTLQRMGCGCITRRCSIIWISARRNTIGNAEAIMEYCLNRQGWLLRRSHHAEPGVIIRISNRPDASLHRCRYIPLVSFYKTFLQGACGMFSPFEGVPQNLATHHSK